MFRNDARPKNETAEVGAGVGAAEEEAEARHRNRVAFAAVTLPVETLAKNEMSPTEAPLGHPGFGGGRVNLTATNKKNRINLGINGYFTIPIVVYYVM